MSEVHAVAVAVALPNGKTQLAICMSTQSIAEAAGTALANFEFGYQLLARVEQSLALPEEPTDER